MALPGKVATARRARRPQRTRRSRGNRRARTSLRERLPDPTDCRRALGRGARRLAPLLIGAAIVGVAASALLVGHWWLTHTERFALTSVEVRGGAQVSDHDVRRLARLTDPQSLFSIDLERVGRAVELSPWVASASASRELPGTLVVHVDEREAAAAVELDGLYLVDPTGKPFKRANVATGDVRDLPIVTGLSRDRYLESPADTEDFIRRGVEAFRAYRADGDRPAIGEVHLHERRGITLLTRDGAMAIALGHGRELAPLDRRLAAFDAAWRALADDERALAAAVYVNNATHPNRVTVGFRTAED